MSPELSTLPPDRADAVRAWLEGSLCECRICEEPVRRIDPRAYDKDAVRPKGDSRPSLRHLGCRDE